jgi:hypothetical protein
VCRRQICLGNLGGLLVRLVSGLGSGCYTTSVLLCIRGSLKEPTLPRVTRGEFGEVSVVVTLPAVIILLISVQ